MNNSHSFKDLECWQQAHEFVKAVYAVTKHFPEDERYGLTSQFRRAAVSIAANICEGYRKLSCAEVKAMLRWRGNSLPNKRSAILTPMGIAH